MNSMIILGFFSDLIEYPTMLLWPLIAGVIVAFIAPLLGTVIVIRRLSFIADTLSHFSLAGICFGVLIGQLFSITVFNDMSPVAMGIIFSVAGTFLIEKLRNLYKNYKELSMPIVMSFGAALTGIFIYLCDGTASNFTTSLLFGSLNSISIEDIIFIFAMAILIILFIIIFYKKIICLCFDESFSRISGINVKRLQLVITLILAVFISVTMQMVGVLLISALMIVPVASSILIGKSFANSCVISIVFSEISVLLGMYFSYVLDLPTGSLIVLINIIILIIVMIIFDIAKKQKKKKKDNVTVTENVCTQKDQIIYKTVSNTDEIKEDN